MSKSQQVRTCSIEGCHKRHLARGLCRYHYDCNRRPRKVRRPLVKEVVEAYGISTKTIMMYAPHVGMRGEGSGRHLDWTERKLLAVVSLWQASKAVGHLCEEWLDDLGHQLAEGADIATVSRDGVSISVTIADDEQK